MRVFCEIYWSDILINFALTHRNTSINFHDVNNLVAFLLYSKKCKNHLPENVEHTEYDFIFL